MKFSLVWGCTYAVATVLIGTSSIAPKSSEKGLTLTVIPHRKDIIL